MKNPISSKKMRHLRVFARMCLLLCIMAFALRGFAQSVVWSDLFTQGITPSTSQCTNWTNFLNSLTPRTYGAVWISGSLNQQGFRITDPIAATQLANLLFTRTAGSVVSGGHTWSVGINCGSCNGAQGVELYLDASACLCSANASIRPQIGNLNWGGLGGTSNCNAPSQSMRVEFTPAFIFTLPVQTNLCVGGNLSVQYSSSGAINSVNTFIAQLSSFNGSFLSPTTIGAITTSSPNGVIGATIPSTTPPGTNYRIRVVSTSPAITGSDNGANITINDLPRATILGASSTVVCRDALANISVGFAGAGPWFLNYSVNGTIFSQSFGSSPGTISLHPSVPTTVQLLSVNTSNCQGQISGGSVFMDVIVPPQLSIAPAFASGNDQGVCGAAMSLNYSLATGTPPVNVTFKTGSDVITFPYNFPIGNTIVTATATNSCGTDTKTTSVTVRDLDPPVILAPAEILASNDPRRCSTNLTIPTPAASDNCSVTETPTATRSDHALLTDPYPVGITTLTWTVHDVNGNVSLPVEQLIKVKDVEAPTIETASPISVPNDPGNCFAVLTLTAPGTSDNCGVASVANDHPSNQFNVGETVVKWTVTDVNGVTNFTEQTIIVTDTEAPVFPALPDLTFPGSLGLCSAKIALPSPAVTDNCELQSITNNQADSIYQTGETIVIWTAEDFHGHITTAQQKVIVTDTEAPTVTKPADITVNNDPGLCSAVVTLISPVATDNCASALTITNDQPDNIFEVGETTIVWNITDASGNTVTTEQKVIVKDTEAPSITAATDITVNTDPNLCTAIVQLNLPGASDNCGLQSLQHDQTDSEFPTGETIVTWTATDIHGNTSTITQKIIVNDLAVPIITTPSNVTVSNDPGSCSATVTLTAPATSDNCGLAGITHDQSDNIFAVGTTVVTWTATDIHGNTATATQTITVNDTEAPQVSPLSDIVLSNSPGLCAAQVALHTPNATDNCGVAQVVNNQTDNLFDVGTTVVIWTVTDVNGNSISVNQNVIVNDNEAPAITGVVTITVNNSAGLCTAIVPLVAPSATDNCGLQSIQHDQTDNEFPVGVTIVTWTATDIHGNTSTASQSIIVNDSEGPVIPAPADITVNNTVGACSATATLTAPVATDNCGVASVANDQADNIFSVGTTIVTWTAIDIHGNTKTAIQKVIVNDIENPTIDATTPVTVANTAGSCSAIVTLTAPAASDNCSIASVTHDQPDNIFPVGQTIVTWTATDTHGHIASSTQTITVTNAAPVIQSVSLSATSVPANSPVSLTTSFTDNNAATATINWGDQTQTISNPASSFNISHTYAAAGTYNITITITDLCGLATSRSLVVTVTSEVDEGKVIGAGWLDSSPGCYPFKGKKKDKAIFEFVAKSGKKTPTPIGETLFKLYSDDLLFRSTSYTSLVIDGSKASFKGKGKVNGVPGYSFLISVVDGDMISRRTPDKFRIKIWGAGGTVIYDNQPGAPDNAQATTAIGGGEIIIIETPDRQDHQHGSVTAREDNTDKHDAEKISAWPNPFTDVVTFRFDSQVNAPLKVQLIDVTGMPVYDKVYEYSDDGMYHLLLADGNGRSGIYILRVNQGIRVEYIKLLRN